MWRRPQTLAAALIGLAAGGALCQPAPAPLVLSGDEILHSGPLRLDERDLHALVTADGVRLRGRVASELPLSLGGRVHLSLRDLDERAVGEGWGELQADADGARFEAWIRPGLEAPVTTQLARHVVHGSVQGLGHTLRFRRSLYQASRQLDAQLILPARPWPGEPFPMLAAVAGAATDAQLNVQAVHDQGPSVALGATALGDDGVAQGVLQAPAAEDGVTVLRAELVGQDVRVRFPQPVALAALPLLSLWTGGVHASVGDRVDVVAWVRSPRGVPRAGARGVLCAAVSPAFGRACTPVVSDARGVLSDRVEVAPALAGRRILLELVIEGASASTALDVATVTPPELPLPGALTPERLEGGDLRVPLRLASVGPGFRLHAELRLSHASGPVLSERDLALDSALEAVQLPLPAGVTLAGDHWVLRLGLEDGVGRRAARDHAYLASTGALAVALHPPELPRAGQPFCVLLLARTLDGEPASTSGSLRLAEQEIAVATDARGTALVCALQAPSGDLRLAAQLRDASDRSGASATVVHVQGLDDPGLDLELPLVLPADQRLSLRLIPRGQAQVRWSWLLASGRVLALSTAADTMQVVAGVPPDSALAVAAFAVAPGGQLWLRERRVLASDSGARLRLEPAPGGQVLPLLHQRSGGDAEPVAWIASAAPALPRSRAVLDEETARELAAQATTPAAHQLLASALQAPVSLSRQRASAAVDSEVLAVATAKVAADLDSIVDDLAERLAQDEVQASELPDWVARRSRVYYDPWGQAYALSLADGQLWLSSAGFDEVIATPDDTRSGRYLHGLLLPSTEPWPAPVRAEDWALALRPWPLQQPASGASLAPTVDGFPLEVLGLTAQGFTLRARAGSSPLLELHAPTALRVRGGDTLLLPLHLRRDGQSALDLQAWTDAPAALAIDATPALIVHRAGWWRYGLSLRAAAAVQAQLLVRAADTTAERQVGIAVLPRDRDQERATLASLCLWLDGSAAWQLDPQPSAARRQRRLRARAYADGLALARALQAALPEPLTLDDARAALALPPAGDPRAAAVQWALASVLARQQADGGLLGDDGRSSVRATLGGIEALATVERAWSTDQPALDVALQWIASSQDSSGALTIEALAADARTLERARLRATARLVLAVADLRPDHEVVERATVYMRSRVSGEHDAVTTALLLRALLATSLDDATRSGLLEQLQARTQFDVDAGAQVFAGEIDDGAEAEVLANVHGLLALRALGIWDALAQAARDVVLRVVQADQVPTSTATQVAVLQALAALPWAIAPSSPVRLQLSDGTTGEVTAGGDTVLPAPSGEVVGTLQGTGPAQLVLLRLEGAPALPLHQGPVVTLEAPSLLSLAVGQTMRLPASFGPDPGLLRVELQSSPCLVAALHTPLRRLTPRADGVLTALLGDDEIEGSAVVVQALCPGQLSLPVLRAAPAAEPWRVSTSAPALVVIE